MTKKRKILGLLSLFLGFMITLAPSARALELVISENGSGSSSTVEIQVETTTTVEQNNQADVSNNVETNADTGSNDANDNTGGDVSVETGDIVSEVGVSTAVNSSSVDVGCCPGDTSATISGNGSGSQNSIELAQTNDTNISVSQEASVVNRVNGNANTGDNTANDNTGGNVSIQTGDIFAGGSVENGPINISSISAGSGGGDVSVKISGNGADSTNSIFASFNSNTNVFLDFFSRIRNKIEWDLNTGGNSANGNTGGDVSIETGDIFFDFFVKNGPVNVGCVDIFCCPFDPGEPPGDGGPPPAGGPDEPHEPGGDDGAGDGDGDGELLPAAAAIEAGGPGIIGLSDTSSENAQTLFFFVGLAMILSGARILATEAHGKQKKNS